MIAKAVDPFVDAQFSLAVLSSKSGLSGQRAASALADEWWGDPIRKRDETGRPGDHGIPEIGRAEEAYLKALTDGQRKAYLGIKNMVDVLFEEGRNVEGVDPWQIDAPIDEWKRSAFQQISTHPMQAYLIGQMLAAEEMRKPVMRPLLPTDGRAIAYLQHHTFNEIDGAFEDLKGALRTQLIEGIQNGENPREVSRRLSNTLNDRETWWDVIAITETARAESQGRLNELKDAGVEWAIGSSAHDARVCPNCLRLIDGRVVRVTDTVGVSNYGRRQADWLAVIPLHPRCRCVWLPYDQRVRKLFAIKKDYDPTEARDESGKWTTGGARIATGSIKPAAGDDEKHTAEVDAYRIHAALAGNDWKSAEEIARANPQALLALKRMKHETGAHARRAAELLSGLTEYQFIQHGVFVQKPKGQTPAHDGPKEPEPAHNGPREPNPPPAPKEGPKSASRAVEPAIDVYEEDRTKNPILQTTFNITVPASPDLQGDLPGGTDLQVSHAGQTWGGHMAGAPADQLRWDEVDAKPDDAWREHAQKARNMLSQRAFAIMAQMPKSVAKGGLKKRVAYLEKWHPALYDHLRLERWKMIGAVKGVGLAKADQDLFRTRKLAALFEERRPKTLADAWNLPVPPPEAGMKPLTKGEIADEYLLWRHSVMIHHPALGLGGFVTYEMREPEVRELEAVDRVMASDFNGLVHSSVPLRIAFGIRDQSKKEAGAYAHPWQRAVMMGVTPEDPVYGKKYDVVISHEVLHALSLRDGLTPEFNAFNKWMRRHMHLPTAIMDSWERESKSVAASPPERNEMRNQHYAKLKDIWTRAMMTAHGFNMKNHESNQWQEDWAIGGSEHAFGHGQIFPNDDANAHVRREVALKIAQLLNRPLSEDDPLVKRLRRLPRATNRGNVAVWAEGGVGEYRRERWNRVTPYGFGGSLGAGEEVLDPDYDHRL